MIFLTYVTYCLSGYFFSYGIGQCSPAKGHGSCRAYAARTKAAFGIWQEPTKKAASKTERLLILWSATAPNALCFTINTRT